MPSSITSRTGSNKEANKQVNPISSSSSAPGSSVTNGPAPVLKTAATLAHLASSKSFNKVVPEDLVVAPLATPQQKVFAFLENKYVSSFLTLCTIFALFGDDIRVSFCSKDADNTIYNLLFVCFIFFSMELILGVYGRPNYFNRGLGFAFYLDLVSTLSVIPDIDWIWSHVIGTTSSGSTSSSQTAALKAGRASRAGTKAGRIVRLVRLFRMLRILRVLKKNKNAEVKTVEISEPSKIGKVLTEKTTRRLIILVLLIIIVSPIIDGTIDLTQDDFQVSQLERLHRYTQDYNQSSEISEGHLKKMVEQYVRDCNGLIIEMHITNVDDVKLKEWLYGVKFQQLDSDKTDWIASSPFTLDKNPKTEWTAAKYLVDDPSVKYRSNEYTTVENLGCYANNVCIDCETATSTNQTCHSMVSFDISSFTISAGHLNIGKTIVVMICFGVSIFVLTRDAEIMVIGPIERMMRLVTQLAQNPLGATEAKKELYDNDEQGEDYETKMLEDTLGKIGRLLQVGFGAAGTEIIAKNMGGAGELDVMIPGKKITSIFGFGIIEHFTETCSLLEEDIITYINTIAEIVHGDAKVFHGAANKNIGSAFLLAWKMCDGSLPGMRDPRDPADKPRMDFAEKLKKRDQIFIKSTGSGTVQRRISPTELVDSALTAVLKMRVDIHNANHHGTLQKFCTNKKLVAAFEDFEVHMGFGLHIGWAIEGAIGSKYKIDASYLSPNVNMAARLEAATGQFDVPMLLSEWFVDELSVEARRFCRKIDRVAVKGSEIPMDLWTFDIGHYPTEGVPPIVVEGKQKAVEFAIDPIYKTLQEGIPKAFFENFHEGIGAYFGGKWDHAKQKLNAANQVWEDGPTKVVLKVMETESKGTFTAPSWWKGFRQLTEK
uniref:Guanylate cyclase domain-containing protein n=1 Tax=Globisporangium ultimum (strain ATCC 200006 / CBS 805.95 / DAOM BR144) TaxID=431595 RepID=K3WBH0_GLOUD